MSIKSAIFDCDGTLIDSMPAWHDVTIQLLQEFDVADVERVFRETEALPMVEMCQAFVEDYGASADTDTLVCRLRELIRDAYSTKIKAIQGCQEFLQAAYDAGVRMVVASSTAPDELSLAIKAQGFDRYFESFFSTGEGIRSKEYPDIWNAVVEYLRVDSPDLDESDIWVFEDAPFGLKSARSVGLHTVCLFSPHGDRDYDECKGLSDILVRDYRELSLPLLNDYADARQLSGAAESRICSADEEDQAQGDGPSLCDGLQDGRVEGGSAQDGDVQGGGAQDGGVQGGGSLKVLIVGGSPERSLSATVKKLTKLADHIVAADGGADLLYELGIAPDVYCGDEDSVSPDALVWVKQVAFTSIEFPSEKYATDLLLAIQCARHEAARQGKPLNLYLTSLSGGRADHALAVIGQLAQAVDASPRLIEDSYELRILGPAGTSVWELDGSAEGKTFSAIPLADDTIVSEKGMRWNLDKRRFDLLSDEGVSNVVEDTCAQVVCHEGILACYLLG